MQGNRKTILQNYIHLAEFLSKCYGDNVEVAVHDTSDLNHSAICIFNGHVSGRSLGAPMTYFGLRVIREKLYQTQNYAVDNCNVLSNGKVLRSSTYFIKDGKGELIGTLCINVDVSQYLQLSRLFGHLAMGNYSGQALTEFPAEGTLDPKETFPTSVEEMLEATIKEYTGGTMDVKNLTARRKIEIVESLNQKGVFMLKGTVKTVSGALGVAESTIYRYLSIANQNNQDE